MIRYIQQARLAGICTGALLAACASNPSAPGNSVDGRALNDESMDVVFATEFPVTSEEEALRQAALADRDGETEKVLFYLVRALQFRPDNVPMLVKIGDIQRQREQLSYAVRAYRMALHYEPEHSAAHEGLGLIYMTKGMDDEAIEQFSLAVAGSGRHWRALNALGVYADKAGDHATAQRHYNQALAAKPDAAHVLNNRGYSRYLAGDKAGAMRDLKEAADDRGFTPAWTNLGKIYAENGWYREALSTYRLVMSEPHALNSTGSVAIDNGDLTQAERYLTEAIRLSPTYFPSAEQNLLLLRELRSNEARHDPHPDSG